MSLILNLTLALGTFLVTTSLLRSPLPWPGGSGVAEKWTYLAEHADEYDVVMMGSSRVYRSFDPRLMEEVWRDNGHKLKAFNLAAPGVGRFEADFLLDQLLALKPAKLKLVIVELWRFDPNEMKRNELTPRAIYWHTGRQTFHALASCFSFPSLTGTKRGKLAMSHLQHFARKLTSFGQASAILDAFEEQSENENLSHVRKSRGYRALESEPFGSIHQRRDLFLEESGRFETAMLERHATARAGDPHEQLNVRALERRVQSLRESGVEIVFVVPPGPWAPPEVLRLKADPLPPVISYSDREQFPWLYSESSRFDRFHVTAEVAKRLSRTFAQELLPHLPSN
jgi:hypothetical protein